MCNMSQMVSILDPVSPHGRRSHSTRWFSVPSVTSLYPFFISASASATALALVCLLYALNSGDTECGKEKGQT